MFSLEKWELDTEKKKKKKSTDVKKKQDISLAKWFAQSICTKHICIVLLKLNQNLYWSTGGGTRHVQVWREDL